MRRKDDSALEESDLTEPALKAEDELMCITDPLHMSDQNAKTEDKAADNSQQPVREQPWSNWSWCEEGSVSREQMVYRGRKDLNGSHTILYISVANFMLTLAGEWEYEFAPLWGVNHFNAVEADRFNLMLVLADQPEQRPNRNRRPRPLNYNDELDQRRRQELADEKLARRLRRLEDVE